MQPYENKIPEDLFIQAQKAGYEPDRNSSDFLTPWWVNLSAPELPTYGEVLRWVSRQGILIELSPTNHTEQLIWNAKLYQNNLVVGSVDGQKKTSTIQAWTDTINKTISLAFTILTNNGKLS